jgi:uncharacterized GH25 family protein
MKFFYYAFALSVVPLMAGDDFYLIPSHFRITAGDKIKVGIHNGSFPQSDIAPEVDRLKDVLVFSNTVRTEVTGLINTGNSVTGDAQIQQKGNAVVTACNDFEKYLRQEGLGHVLETPIGGLAAPDITKSVRERFSQYAKSLLMNDSGSSDILQKPTGMTLEFVPEKNPSALRRDERLPVRVLWNGKPAPGLQVEAAYSTGEYGESRIVGRTDRDGRVFITLGKKGLWRLHTVAMERCRDPRAADFESSRATLTFEIR